MASRSSPNALPSGILIAAVVGIVAIVGVVMISPGKSITGGLSLQEFSDWLNGKGEGGEGGGGDDRGTFGNVCTQFGAGAKMPDGDLCLVCTDAGATGGFFGGGSHLTWELLACPCNELKEIKCGGPVLSHRCYYCKSDIIVIPRISN